MNEYPLALVTGAAHRLGRLFALTLARNGFAILLHYYQSAEAANGTAEEVRAFGVPVYPVKADLTDAAQIRSLFTVLDSSNLSLKVLINSAAGMRHADIRTITEDEWDQTLNLNLRAPLLIAQKAAERMTDGGIIVNVTDAGIWKAWTGFPAYLISKAGLDTLTRLLAKTYAPTIRVNAIAPGLVLPSAIISDNEWNAMINRLPLKRSASADEIASALEYILKNDSVTGQTIVIDGGYSLI
jgi:NAD(P)-dependent dehydrogenase (short-subunit alcohol dehydrogenase family)